jgi:hypothetical protein
MTGTLTFFDTPSAQWRGSTVEIFDPPMCCPTGLCGPTLDQTLLDVNEMILALKAEGVQVERYQITSHPHKFTSSAAVMQLVQQRQLEALPITIVQGQVIKAGVYPTLAEVTMALNGSLNHKIGDLS